MATVAPVRASRCARSAQQLVAQGCGHSPISRPEAGKTQLRSALRVNKGTTRLAQQPDRPVFRAAAQTRPRTSVRTGKASNPCHANGGVPHAKLPNLKLELWNCGSKFCPARPPGTAVWRKLGPSRASTPPFFCPPHPVHCQLERSLDGGIHWFDVRPVSPVSHSRGYPITRANA